jgi:hypothetical protein
MTTKLLEEHAIAYAKLSGMTLNLKSPLGYGNDGSVWKSSKNSAVKALESERKYSIEAQCYKRFAENGITKIDGFAVPQLFGYNDDLLVIEMGIVTAPYILDFAKAWLDQPPDFSEEALADWEAEGIENFGEERWPTVCNLLYGLRPLGIFYYDAKPQNIRFADWAPDE